VRSAVWTRKGGCEGVSVLPSKRVRSRSRARYARRF